MPIGAVGNPHFRGFANPKEARAKKTHHLLGGIQKIRQASLSDDFGDKSSLYLHKRVRETKMVNSFMPSGLLLATNRENKGDRKWTGPWIIIGRFVGNMQ